MFCSRFVKKVNLELRVGRPDNHCLRSDSHLSAVQVLSLTTSSRPSSGLWRHIAHTTSSRSSIPWLFGLILPGRLFHATMACNTSSRSYHIDSTIITDCFHFWLFGHYSGMVTSMYMRAKERQILKQGEAAPLDAPLFSLFLHWCLNDWSMASDIWEWKILR